MQTLDGANPHLSSICENCLSALFLARLGLLNGETVRKVLKDFLDHGYRRAHRVQDMTLNTSSTGPWAELAKRRERQVEAGFRLKLAQECDGLVKRYIEAIKQGDIAASSIRSTALARREKYRQVLGTAIEHHEVLKARLREILKTGRGDVEAVIRDFATVQPKGLFLADSAGPETAGNSEDWL